MVLYGFAIGEDERHLQQAPTNDSELNLLFACARWPQRERDRRLIAQLAASQPDWRRFVQLAKHHRVIPLISHNLNTVLRDGLSDNTRETVAELRQYAGASVIRSLHLLNELRRVIAALNAADISVRVLKGFPLARLVFGDISLRAPGDLDLLIDGRKLIEADRVLRGLGYTGLFLPERFTPKQLAFYRAHWKDITYNSDELGLELDLHWRCFRNPYAPGVGLCSSRAAERVTFGGFTVETPARREGLLYLCVHGTLDGWVYLKALVDVAAQVREMSAQELDALAELARTYCALPELSATLLLVRRWFTMDHWSRCLLPESDRTVRHILRYVEETLEVQGFRASREEFPIGHTLWFEWGLRRNWRYRWEVLQRVLYRARMWDTIPLPDWLFWAYPLLSPVEWLLFRIRQRRAQAANV